MLKRRLLAALAVIIYAVSAAIAGQERPWSAETLPQHGKMRDIAASDRYHFWAVGDSGNILESTEGGTMWTRIHQVQGTSALNAVAFDISTGVLAVGNGGVIVRLLPETEPTEHRFDDSYTFSGVDAENQVAIVVGTGLSESPLVYRSTDGGAHFTQVTINFPLQRIVLAGVQFLSTTDVVIYGSTGGQQDFGSPLIYVSHDAGRTWSAAAIDQRDMVVTAVERVGGSWVAVGMHAGQEVGILRSQNNGETWQFEEHNELNIVTDLVRGEGMDLMAFGIRLIDASTDPKAVLTEFRSTDAGRSWETVDMNQTGTVVRAARGGDMMVAIGQESAYSRRWYDRSAVRTAVNVERKHLEIGNVIAGTTHNVVFADVLKNYSSESREITAIKLHQMDGVEVLSPKAGDLIAPGSTQSVTISHERLEHGEAWGVLTVYFDDLTSAALYVSSFTQEEQFPAGIELVNRVVDLGDIKDMRAPVQQHELFTNTGSTPINVEGLVMQGYDNIMFAYDDVPRYPVTVQPGETFSIKVSTRPLTKGIYHVVNKVVTNKGAVYIPMVATCRQDAVDDVVNLGTVKLGDQIEAETNFQHFLWNTGFDVGSVNEPMWPMVVSSTTPLPFWGKPYDRFAVKIKLEASQQDIVASILSVDWNYGFTNFRRRDRRIVMAKVINTGTTSVHEPAVRNEPISIYPQPATSAATVALPPNVAWTTLSLVDVQGRTLYTGNVPSGAETMDLDVSDLRPGVYHVVLRSADSVAMSPLMKN